MYTKRSKKVEEFIERIVFLCKESQLSIVHEDTQGAFIIEEYKEENIKWFNDAFDKIKMNY